MVMCSFPYIVHMYATSPNVLYVAVLLEAWLLMLKALAITEYYIGHSGPLHAPGDLVHWL